jgi:hypothetical protein
MPSKRSIRYLNKLRREFMESRSGEKSFEAVELARWAIANGKLSAPPPDVLRVLAERKIAQNFSDAMREEYAVDGQGREVREMHAARIGGKVRWHNRSEGSRGFLETSVRQQRDQIVGNCRHLKSSVDSLNENRWPENPIQLPLDFTNDIAELEAAEKTPMAS